MKDALERGLSAVNEFVPEFMAGHAGRMEVYTYGPEGRELRTVSYDVGVHEIDGADATEWVTEGAMIVISMQRRRRADAAEGASTGTASAHGFVGVTARVVPQAVETEPATYPDTVPAAHPANGGAHSGGAARGRTDPAMDAPPHTKPLARSVPYKSVKGVVPRMPLAPDVER